MSSSRYPDGNRYPRERSPYRDRRGSSYAGGYVPRGSESNGRNPDSGAFPPRDVPRGPKSLVDAPRGPTSGPPSGVPSGPRDGRGRGFAGRGDGPPSLRDAPPLTTATHNPRDHNSRDHWRADRDRDRDRDRDFRDRRPSPPPRRSPIRDVRELTFNVERARRNSRDGPPSAGSTYSDPPLGSGSSYRGSGIGRGRGGGRDFSSEFRPRGRGYHNDDRDRHHDPRDARDVRDRIYRPRSRSREPVRRERDIRDDRDFDRRDRDDRRFERREEEPRRYDSYLGSAGVKPGVRALDTHRGSVASESRNLPGTPTGPPTPHSAHHPASTDRLGPSVEQFSRRSSVATEPLSAKDARRESDRNDLIASRAESSKERYAPRASSPPAAVPAFGFSGFSNVWRNPALDAKPASAAQTQKSVAPAPPVPVPAPASTNPAPPPAAKPSIPSGLSTAPPTGPKADRIPDRLPADGQSQDSRPPVVEPSRPEPTSRPPPTLGPLANILGLDIVESKALATAPSQANSPPLSHGPRNRPPPTGPHAALRPNMSPSFSRPQQPLFTPRDASPGAIPSGPRNTLSISTSPKTSTINIPTGPKADRTNPMASRPPMYAPPDRPPFSVPRLPLVGGPKSMQWVRPGLNRPPTIPTKREFPNEDRERAFGTAPKAPKLEGSVSVAESLRSEQPRPEVSNPVRTMNEMVAPKEQAPPEPVPKATSPKPSPIGTRRVSDVSMSDVSPHTEKPPVSAASSAPEVMEDSDDEVDLDEEDFAESEAKYNREKALLESKRIDLSAAHLRATTPLQQIMLLSSLTADHLPQPPSKSVEEEVIPPTPIQPQPESTTTELLTPKAEEPEDVLMEDKPETPMAPATRALRLRQEPSAEREATPADFSSLPYLESGPPTPLSNPEQDRPSIPDSVLSAIRTNLQKDSAPRTDAGDVLRQYAAAYKSWRLAIRELDDGREQDDPERQPSAEPGLRVTTPDVQSSAMAAMLDIPPPATGRRGHSYRFATEFDLEQVIKESLKTAEEERMGKRDREPKKAIWDPEREAAVPLELTEYEAQRRRFIDTNFQREPGQGIFVYHYEPPEDDFTEEEHRIMVQHYKDQYAKKWGKLAEILHKEAGTSRTYKDTINHYYASKWAKEYKHKAKRRNYGRRRGVGVSRGRGGPANVERCDPTGEDGLTPATLTESGRPRRSAAPIFGLETEGDPGISVSTPRGQRRQNDVDGTSEKGSRRGKLGKEKGGRKKNQPIIAAPPMTALKLDKKERALGFKTEEDFSKRQLDLPVPMLPIPVDDHMSLQGDGAALPGMMPTVIERPRSHTNSRQGPSSYWSVTEQTDFQRNLAHFGTDWVAIANHMGTKTHIMVKNQYMRLIENGGSPELKRLAEEADQRRDRGEELGPPPTPTPAQKRRYDPSATLPRTLAPTPETAEMRKSPPGQTNVPAKFSPPYSTTRPIVQAPQQAKPIVPAAGSLPVSEALHAPLPSVAPQHSPPIQPPRVQGPHHQHTHSQHKPGPRMGFFSDPPRAENRVTTQSSSLAQPGRPLQQPIQPQTRSLEPAQPVLFRATAHQERETHQRSESRLDHDLESRFPQHTRRISQDLSYPRPFQTGPPQHVPQIRAISGAGSPENRSLPLKQSRHISQPQPSVQPSTEGAAQPSNTATMPPQLGPRPTVGTPPVKEEPQHYPLPPHPPHSQPTPHLQSQSSTYPQPSQAAQPSAPQPVPKPATEPRKSNLLSLLNDTEPEEPRRKKPTDVPSHTPTPQQQVPIAPPPPVTQSLPPRRDPYIDPSTTQAPYPRPSYTPQAPMSQGPPGRQIVDLTSEQSGARQHPRESWQQRQTFHPAQSQAQQPSSLNPSHVGFSQSVFGSDSRILGNHRAFLAQHNTPRHNPSPPPLAAYNNSPHMHSRTPSISGAPQQQQSRHGINNSTPVQTTQPAPGTSQILQPNPYAQVDPQGPGAQPSGIAGMRPSPHLHASHITPQRDMQSRSEQSQAHNPNLPYSNPPTPSELHPAHQHLRGPSMTDQYRHRDSRDFHHDFDARNHDRDMARELSQRADVLLRDRDSMMPRTGGPPQSHQDLRYQPTPQPDRGYPGVQRSHTPLSRTEHSQHPSLQHPPPHSLLSESGRPVYGQRPQEEQHRYRDPFPSRDDRLTDRIREEQAHQQARMRGEDYLSRDREMREREMRDREMRERDARYREDLQRRGDGRLPGPPPSGPPPHSQPPQGHEQRSGPGPMDWTSAVSRHQERWQR